MGWNGLREWDERFWLGKWAKVGAEFSEFIFEEIAFFVFVV